MASHHHLSRTVTRGRDRSASVGWEDLPMPRRWTLAAAGSVGVGGYVLVRFFMAGAPAAGSVGAAAIIAVALLVHCAILFRVQDHRASRTE